MGSMQVQYTTHNEDLRIYIDTTQELSWQAEADTLIIGVTYIYGTLSSTPYAQQERWLYTWTAVTLLLFLCSPSPMILPLVNLHWSHRATCCHCWHLPVYVA